MKKSVKSITFSADHIIHKLPKMLGCSNNDILFIDIETTGLSPRTSDIYMIGLGYYDDGFWHILQLFAENASEEAKILKIYSQNFSDHSKVLSFNGDKFDLPFLKNKLAKHNISDPLENATSIDFHKVLRPYQDQLGLIDCKQKTIEMYLGITRKNNYDSKSLIPIYNSYKKAVAREPLEILFLHNYEDVKGMFSLLPMLYFLKFFSLFSNMPKISIKTDEPVSQDDYMDPNAAEDDILLPVRARKVQVNCYNDYEGNQKKEIFMRLSLPFPLPSSLTGHLDDCYFKIEKDEAILRVPIFEAELKYFYSNYNDYYYLPKEDTAIHKSIASFVDRNYRVKAKPETCYTKKAGQYLREWDLVFAPFFKSDYKDDRIFFDLNANLKQSRFALSVYASHIIAHILEI